MLTLSLFRHAKSSWDDDTLDDFERPLARRGEDAAPRMGAFMARKGLAPELILCSPSVRTRQTLDGLLCGAGLQERPLIHEDPRLREVEHGYYDYESQQWDRAMHGWFYYRFRGGESPADCFDRVSTFLETLMRQVRRKQIERMRADRAACDDSRAAHLELADNYRAMIDVQRRRRIAAVELKAEPPFTPGAEVAGTVVEAGEKVKNVRPGDAVAALLSTGGYAEEAVTPAEMLMPLPRDMDFKDAASFPMIYGTSYHALVDGHRRARAEALLRNLDYGIAEVSARVGYEDPANFGRACRRWFGMAPGAYRKRLQAATDPSA